MIQSIYRTRMQIDYVHCRWSQIKQTYTYFIIASTSFWACKEKMKIKKHQQHAAHTQCIGASCTVVTTLCTSDISVASCTYDLNGQRSLYVRSTVLHTDVN